MDHNRFDELTRWLALGAARRNMLRTLAAGVLATGLGGLVLHDADAKCTQIGKKCKSKNGKKKKCCGGAKCKGSNCKCPSGTVACNGVCTAGECCDDSDCAPDGLCGNGTCYFPPDCGGAPSHCFTNAECCSNSCILPDTEFCAKSTIGEPCHVDSDCVSNICFFFECRLPE